LNTHICDSPYEQKHFAKAILAAFWDAKYLRCPVFLSMASLPLRKERRKGGGRRCGKEGKEPCEINQSSF
jgi:hypothetical protein